MDARSDTPTTRELFEVQSAELAALRRMLVASEGIFSFSVAICNSPSARNYLISKLREEFPSITVVEVNKEVTDILDFVRKAVTSKSHAGIFVIGIEKLLPSDRKEHKVLRALNVTREAWQSNFSCPIVFWLPEYAATLLSIHARDFWSWLSHTFEFVSEQATAMAGMLDTYAGDTMSAGRLDADQKRFRIAELERRIEDTGEPIKPELVQHVLTWLNELAYIYRIIGDLDKAEEDALKSLYIAEKFSIQAEMANAYGNLGLIYRRHGDLDKAEQMQKKALEIKEKLGLLGGMANQYGNLGVIYRTRGDLDKAEQMHTKALEIDEKLGLLEGLASDYGNLGLIYQTRGDLDKAEHMLTKALEIHEKLGSLEGMANDYGNLGLIYQTRGDLGKAEHMLTKALEFFEKIGMKQEIEKVQRAIDELKDKEKNKEKE
jgi:Tfp pilus assembly protein PilF